MSHFPFKKIRVNVPAGYDNLHSGTLCIKMIKLTEEVEETTLFIGTLGHGTKTERKIIH